jgi:recombination protein RecT
MSDAPAVKTESRIVSIARLKDNQPVGVPDMRRLVGELTPVLAKTLPSRLRAEADRYGSALLIEMNRSDTISKCTALSLLGVLMQASQLGLELGGPLGYSYITPYWSSKLKAYEAQLAVGYKGLIALANRADPTKVLDAHPVFEADEFDFDLGTKPFVKHRPPKRGDRGALVGVYAYYAVIGGDAEKIEYMSAEEIERHRDRYAKKDKSGQFSAAWTTGFEMFRKTPLRRLAKRVPLSVELMRAATLDEYADEDVPQSLGALVRTAVDPVDLPTSRAAEVAEAIGAGDDSSGPVDGDDIPR